MSGSALLVMSKASEDLNNNQDIINDFQKKPGLIHISKNRGVDVAQVYNIIKTHDINVLNTNIIKLMEFK